MLLRIGISRKDMKSGAGKAFYQLQHNNEGLRSTVSHPELCPDTPLGWQCLLAGEAGAGGAEAGAGGGGAKLPGAHRPAGGRPALPPVQLAGAPPALSWRLHDYARVCTGSAPPAVRRAGAALLGRPCMAAVCFGYNSRHFFGVNPSGDVRCYNWRVCTKALRLPLQPCAMSTWERSCAMLCA